MKVTVRQAKHASGRVDLRNRFQRRNWLVTIDGAAYHHQYVYRSFGPAIAAADYLARGGWFDCMTYTLGLIAFQRTPLEGNP